MKTVLLVFISVWTCALGVARGQTAPTTAPYAPHKLGISYRGQAWIAESKNDLPTARDCYQKWLNAFPRDSASWYDLSCIQSKLGHKGESLDALETAVDLGYADAEHAQADTDLSSIRADPRFAAAIARIPAVLAAQLPSHTERRFAPMRSMGTYLALLPPDYESAGKTYPLCVLLHGSGDSETSDASFADELGRDGVIYLAVRAPYADPEVSLPGHLGWTGNANDLPAHSPQINLARQQYPEWIMDCVGDARSHYRIRPGKIFIHGYSQGAFAAVECALRYPEQIGSILVLSGGLPRSFDLISKNLPRVKAEGVRVTVIHGTEDDTVPVQFGKDLAKTFTDAGIPTTLLLTPGGHIPTAERTPLMRGWVDKEIRAKP